jgi:NADPH:quinone reductase-like Zn-dependent oxidoreductase
VRFHELGGPDVLRPENLDVPPPAASEVKIRVEAIGLNRAELAFRAGRYLERPKLPSRLGYEACGTVISVGDSVHGFMRGLVTLCIGGGQGIALCIETAH